MAPILLVFIWSSGFIVARAAWPHAAPELVLLLRMALTAAALGLLTRLLGQGLPRGWRLGLHLLAGALLNGLYLCTSWRVISRGMPASVMALLGALQPLIVAVGSFLLLHERLSTRGRMGLIVGLSGVTLVLLPLLAEAS